MLEHPNVGAYKSAMLFTTTSCFHSFWDRANLTIPKIAIFKGYNLSLSSYIPNTDLKDARAWGYDLTP